ncbi:MAG: hypothetical protein IPM21_13905 [Acidobacteria bacterium]|nr:hypothetical protein [Acidobacteriota bacterium]
MLRTVFVALVFAISAILSTAQMPPIEPGVPLELAKWRAAHYSDVRYKLNLTLEKMSPVLKGTMEIRLKAYGDPVDPTKGRGMQYFHIAPIILDWRRIRGHEELSTISNVSVNGRKVEQGSRGAEAAKEFHGGETRFAEYYEYNEHLFFSYGVVSGENVIKLDFTSPILTSGSAITRYVDKEDGSEYIYSLFVPSDASTAFPVFDQPDLKARFDDLTIDAPQDWKVVANSEALVATDTLELYANPPDAFKKVNPQPILKGHVRTLFRSTKPISTYVFAFAAGNFDVFDECKYLRQTGTESLNCVPSTDKRERRVSNLFVRRSQAEKFRPHAAEVFRLNREAIKYFEEYFDYKFPFPKYDLVLIPEFPFGGMEHAGATFLRESSIIFPQEPIMNDHISRALLISQMALHQWLPATRCGERSERFCRK